MFTRRCQNHFSYLVNNNVCEVLPPVSNRPAFSHPSFRLSGTLRVPGDKSISHRALIFGALAQGQTTIAGLLEGEDVLATMRAMRILGARIEKNENTGQWQVTGFGADGAQTPKNPLDFGNAGTGVRLAMGLVAGLGVEASFLGDESLSRRPMGRVLRPLAALGVRATSKGERLPLTIHGSSKIAAQATEISIASAQIKTALLLAGMHSDGITEIIEPALSRDHSERMLTAFGADITSEILADGRNRVQLAGPADLRGTHINVPGDPSSAAFAITAALCIADSDITLQGVLMNPTRTGFIDVARRMGGKIDIVNQQKSGGEDIADLHVRGSQLHGVETAPEIAPSMIDEFPALAVLASFARGTTKMLGIGELRVKESDRIARSEDLLRNAGISTKSGDNWLQVTGTGAVWGNTAPDIPVPVRTDGDHRIAMSALVLGLAAFQKVQIDDPSSIATSYPNFYQDMQSLGANMALEQC